MKLSELEKGDIATIQAINTSDNLKRRLNSFGVVRGSQLSVEAYSLANKTIEIMVDDTLIGLRAAEAADIQVEREDG
jgi:ferrous iron transport protein A